MKDLKCEQARQYPAPALQTGRNWSCFLRLPCVWNLMDNVFQYQPMGLWSIVSGQEKVYALHGRYSILWLLLRRQDVCIHAGFSGGLTMTFLTRVPILPHPGKFQ